MTLYTLDWVVRNYLLKRGYSLHWYMQTLLHSVDCLVDLYADDLKVVNTRILPVNSYGAVDLPEGFNDAVGVFIKAGQKLQPLTEDNTINPLNNMGDDFAISRWDEPTNTQTTDQSVVQIAGLLNTWFFGFAPYNSIGEPVGKFFGIGNPTNKTYKIIKERNQIQLSERLSTDHIVLQWIGDGRNSDSISSVESYALATIRAYIDYRLKDFNRSYSRGEVEMAKQEYYNERKRLRSRKSDLTVTALRQIIMKNQRLSVKG